MLHRVCRLLYEQFSCQLAQQKLNVWPSGKCFQPLDLQQRKLRSSAEACLTKITGGLCGRTCGVSGMAWLSCCPTKVVRAVAMSRAQLFSSEEQSALLKHACASWVCALLSEVSALFIADLTE